MPKQHVIKKNGNDKVIHPNSRKAERVIANAHRNEKMKRREKEKNIKSNLLFDKLVWFKNNLPDDSPYFTVHQIHDLIEKYLTRHHEGQKLSELSKSIVGDKHCLRDEVKRISLLQEIDEYNGCGIHIPDLTTKKNINTIREWNGESNLIPSIRLVAVKTSDGRRTQPSINKDNAYSQSDNELIGETHPKMDTSI